MLWGPRIERLARKYFRFPTPADWFPVAQAMSDGYNVMMVYDKKREEWRVDFIKNGIFYSGDSYDLAFAIEYASKAQKRAENNQVKTDEDADEGYWRRA